MINVAVFIVKCWLLVFVMMWVRWTLPRLRIDQVMMTCLKYLLPISCVLLWACSLWQVLVPGGVAVAKYGLAMARRCSGGRARRRREDPPAEPAADARVPARGTDQAEGLMVDQVREELNRRRNPETANSRAERRMT